MKINFNLNGSPVSIDAPANITLLSLLREKFGLTGTKIGCEVGECGACSVLIDGKVVNSCMLLAPQINDRTIITIEGIHDPNGGPNDLQRSLVENGAVQCGYCTPGMVMAGEALLVQTLSPSEDEIRNAIAGNLCRCTGYQQIVEAIEMTANLRRRKFAGQTTKLEEVQ
jgi:carbon-monoxide dehydrogenase small subunit